MRISLHEHRRVFTSPAPREESKATNRAGHDGIKTQPWRTAGRARQKTRSENGGRDAEGGARVGARTGKTERWGRKAGSKVSVSMVTGSSGSTQTKLRKMPHTDRVRGRSGRPSRGPAGPGGRELGAGSCLGSCHICKSPPQATPDGTGVTTTPPPSGTWSSARGAARPTVSTGGSCCMDGVRKPGGVSAAPWAETQRQGGSRQGQPWTPRGQARLSPASHAARHPPGETIPAPDLSMQSRPHPLLRMLATCLPLSWPFMSRSCFSGSSPRVTPPFLAGLQLSEDRDCPTHCHWVSEPVRSRHPIRIILKAKQKEDSQRQGQCPPNVPLPVLEAGRWRAPPALEFHCGRLESSSKAPS